MVDKGKMEATLGKDPAMSFRDNLQYLRAQRSMTQEQLAMLLGVSRQSISKWESEKAYPEMDKLLMICDMFGCTLDDLVLGDVSSPGDASAPVSSPRSPSIPAAPTAYGAFSPAAGVDQSASNAGAHVPQDVTGYDEHSRTFARHIAVGVPLIIIGVGVGLLFDSSNSVLGSTPANNVWQFVCIACGVVAGLGLIIPGGMGYAEFQRRHPYVEDFYTDEDRAKASQRLAVGVVVGIAWILAGISQMIYSSEVLHVEDGWPVSLLLFAIAIGVGSFIYCGIRQGLMDIERYNTDAERDRSETSHAKDDYYEKVINSICGIIMLLATIIGLIMLFTGTYGNDDSTFFGGVPFWIPWPIGGVLCAVVASVGEILRANSEHRGRR